MKKQVFIFCMLFLLVATLSFGQTPIPNAPKTPEKTQPTEPGNPKPIPEPYTEEEFPEWMLDLRRAEIVFFGTMPFSFLIALEAVDIGRYFAHNQERIYGPWPFRDPAAPAFTTTEQLLIVGSALFISLTTAVIDFFINKAIQASQRKQELITAD